MAANATVHGGVGKVHLAAHDAVKALQGAVKKISATGAKLGNDTLRIANTTGHKLASASMMGGGKLHSGAAKGSETVSAGHVRFTADTFSGGAAKGAGFHIGADTVSANKDLFLFKSDHTGGSHVIQAFKAGADKLVLAGYGKKELAAALHSQKVVGGSLTLKLSDKTTVTISGLDHKLSSSDFIIK